MVYSFQEERKKEEEMVKLPILVSGDEKKVSIEISLGKKRTVTSFPRPEKNVCPLGGLPCPVVIF